MMCFNKKFYLFFLKHLFHPISDRFGPYFGPFRSEFDRIGPRSENGKKKKKIITGTCAAASTTARCVRAYRTQVSRPNRRTCAF